MHDVWGQGRQLAPALCPSTTSLRPPQPSGTSVSRTHFSTASMSYRPQSAKRGTPGPLASAGPMPR